MALNAKKEESNSGGTKEVNPLESKMYPARCVQIIDLGVQKQRPFKGQAKDPCHSVRLTYELSHEFMKDEAGNILPDKPRWISEELPFYNLEADKAKSSLRYKALDPNDLLDGDFLQLPTLPCQVMVTKVPDKKNEGFFKNYIGDVSGPMEVPGYEQPLLVNPTTVFSLDEPDLEVFKSLPDWLQKKIKENLGYEGGALQKALGEKPAAVPVEPPVPPVPPAPIAPIAPVVPIAPPAPIVPVAPDA